MARRAGRQLPPWQEVETVQLNGFALRERALEWLGQKEKVTHPLVTPSERGHRDTWLDARSIRTAPKSGDFSVARMTA